MAIMIHEYLDGNGGMGHGFADVKGSIKNVNISEASVEQNIDPNSLMVDIEAIHAIPYATRNYTRYTEKCLKNSVTGWTKPYSRPLIKHHNEKNGDIIGRVVGASYKSSNTFSNTPALVLTVNIPGEQAKADVKNGINQTVSIGVIAEDVRCSICGKQIELDSDGNVISCEHQRGNVYDKETAYWDVYSMEPKEVSYVIVPSDMFAGNVKSYPATKSTPKITESYSDIKSKGEIKDMSEMDTKLQNAESKIGTLEESLKTVTTAKTDLEKKVTELSEAVEEGKKKVTLAEAKATELQEKITSLETANSELTKKVSDLSEAKKELEEKNATDLKMQEGLETELANTKIALKESLIDTLQALRKVSGKVALDQEQLKNREESSIRDSIADLKLELKEAEEKPELPGNVTSPALAEEAKDTSNVNLKENEQISNVDLKAGLENLFMAIAGARR